MGYRRFCNSRFRRYAWQPSTPAQEVGCVLFVYRVATWCDCDNDAYPWHRYRLRSRRDLGDYSDAAGGGGIFDLVFEAGREQGLGQLGTADDQKGEKGDENNRVQRTIVSNIRVNCSLARFFLAFHSMFADSLYHHQKQLLVLNCPDYDFVRQYVCCSCFV